MPEAIGMADTIDGRPRAKSDKIGGFGVGRRGRHTASRFRVTVAVANGFVLLAGLPCS